MSSNQWAVTLDRKVKLDLLAQWATQAGLAFEFALSPTYEDFRVLVLKRGEKEKRLTVISFGIADFLIQAAILVGKNGTSQEMYELEERLTGDNRYSTRSTLYKELCEFMDIKHEE